MEHLELYTRQAELVDGIPTVHVIGCGGVGTWAAMLLALAGADDIHLYDDDVVAESNLNRLPWTRDAIGKAKTAVLTAYIESIRPLCVITVHGKFNDSLHVLSGRVIGAVDTMGDRQKIHRRCERDGAVYIDVGAESHHCNVSDSPADWTIGEDRPGYFTPIWSAPVVVAAGLAVAAAVNGIIPGSTIGIDLRTMSVEGV